MSVGAHISGRRGRNEEGATQLKNLGGNIVQFFISGDGNYSQFRRLLQRDQMRAVVHASYSINLSRDWDQYSPWIQQFIYEITSAHEAGAEGIVVHMGKQMELTKEEAYNNMYTSLLHVHTATLKASSVKILLETSTGQGSEICHRIEDLAYFYKKFSRNRNKEVADRFGLCVDTCHIFGAGYDLRTKSAVYMYLEAFEELIGLHHIRLLHLNDSKRELGSNVDRHENLGYGRIGKEGLLEMARYFKNLNVPIILETPTEHIREDLALVLGLSRCSPPA